jgi:RNA polymerase sigma-70 factor (ECF subfamily)
LRKKNVRKIFVPIKEADEKFENTSSTETDDISKIVTEAVAKLPNKLRIPLLLKDIEGFSYQEIAETINCEMGTVKSRIFRAREGLKKILQPMESELM